MHQAPAEWAPTVVDLATEALQKEMLGRWLLSLEPTELPSAVIAAPTAEHLAHLKGAGAQTTQGRQLVGVAAPLGLRIDPWAKSGFGKRVDSSEGWIWSAVIRVPGATAVRLHFEDFDLPSGAALYVYDGDDRVFGPYRGRGPSDAGVLWTHALLGEQVRVQLHLGLGNEALSADRWPTLHSAVHLGEGFRAVGSTSSEDAASAKAFCSYNAPCITNAAIVKKPSQVNVAREGMAHLVFSEGPFSYICSGGLMNDTDPTTSIPYLLTANHCFSTQAVASSLQAFFDYFGADQCGGPPSQATVVGSTLLATGEQSDFTLVELDAMPPGRVFLLGWTTTPVASSNGTKLYRIHHPKGAPQAYSVHTVNTSATTCTDVPRGEWIYSSNETIEGGSSGSPVMLANGQVVGQLTGSCGFSSGSCDLGDSVIDGALASYFSQVQAWLDP